MGDAMTRRITIEAPDNPDLPVDLQVVQEAGAGWNGETIELTWNVVLAGRYETLRAPITTGEAQLPLDRLQAALQAQTSSRRPPARQRTATMGKSEHQRDLEEPVRARSLLPAPRRWCWRCWRSFRPKCGCWRWD